MNTKEPLKKWPDFFVPGAPPADAAPASGEAFRLVPGIPPNPNDFRATREEFPERSYEGIELINSCATSFHTALEASKRTRQRYKGLKLHRIARGTLTSNHGVQKPTGGRDHLSVWLFLDARPHLAFTVDAEI